MVRVFLLGFLIFLNGASIFATLFLPKTGFFVNHLGHQCWYDSQSSNSDYFSRKERLVYVHNFKLVNAMTNTSLSKSLIAKAVSRWYKESYYHKDTDFLTDVHKWRSASSNQLRGFNIVASNHRLPSIWIDFDYSRNMQFITRVYHSRGED